MKKRVIASVGLLLTDLSIFAVTSTFLPLRGSFGHSGPWSYFINSRYRWDIAWGVLVSAVILSIAAFLFLEAFGAFETRRKRIDSDGSGEE